jgi:NitT/TauT family transport system permease protein
MIQKPISERATLILGVSSVLILLGLYTLLSQHQHAKNPQDSTIPTWSQLKDGVVKAIAPDPVRGERWLVEDIKATGSRLLIGLGLGVVGAIFIGVFMGCFPVVEAFLLPPLKFFSRVIPTAALAVFFALAGTDMTMYATMIVFGILPSLAIGISLGVKEFPEELRNKTYTLGASNTDAICNAVVKYVLPRMIEQIKLSIGPAMVYLIAAELLVGDAGMGYRIRILSRRLEMQVVYPYLVFLTAFGFLIDVALGWLKRLLCPWHREGG